MFGLSMPVFAAEIPSEKINARTLRAVYMMKVLHLITAVELLVSCSLKALRQAAFQLLRTFPHPTGR